MSTGLLSRMGGTSLRLVGRRQQSSRCSRMGGTNRLHLGIERERHSGCSRMDGTCIHDLRAAGKRNRGGGGQGKLGKALRGCSCELLFGDGAVEDSLDG